MKKFAVAMVIATLFSIHVGNAFGDDDPDPNRLPGPKHFNPESCKKYPEICKARADTLRRRYQDCLDSGRSDCTPPPGSRKNAKQRAVPAAAEAPAEAPPQP